MDDNHHLGWIVVVGILGLAGLGLVAWIYASNRPDVNNYGKGANPITTEIRHISLVDINPCGVLFKIDPDKIFKKADAVKTTQDNTTKVVINAAKP